jgi:predicted adenine nucleotide alpha hydrolase (AANH) superfamily ATPase
MKKLIINESQKERLFEAYSEGFSFKKLEMIGWVSGDEQVKYCEKLGVKYKIGEYDHDAWRAAVRGLEAEPERGARCSVCFVYRFEYAKKFTRENGYNAIGAVLGVSRHKDQAQVDAAGESAPGDTEYLPIKWDENLRVQINRESDFYRENYRGCEFSIRKV